jgi:hypothetical protein
MRPTATAYVAALLLAAGCNDAPKDPIRPIVHPVPEFSTQELLAAPEALKFSGIAFDVTAALWRDFQPVSPPEGRGLAAAVEATALGEPVYPSEIVSAYVWVLWGDDRWESWLKPQGSPAGEPATMRYGAADGPLWGPGIEVEVVVGFRTSSSVVHLVKIPGVPVTRTD